MPSIELNDLDYLILKCIADLNKMTVDALVQSAISKLISERIETGDCESECQNLACLKRFNVTRYRRKYCSKVCEKYERNRKSKIKRRKEKRTVKCSECAKPFHLNHELIRTCSETCKRLRANRLKQINYRKHNPPRRPDIQTCIICDKGFETLNRNTKICSAECRRARRVQLESRQKGSTRP
jgi:predicted DNA-binding ribbon-helix-helix protein